MTKKSSNHYLIILFITLLMHIVNCHIPAVTEYFPSLQGSLLSLEWAHATNSHQLLEEGLNNLTVQMLEADVILGTHPTSGSIKIPVMGHPPAQSSDLSLQQFVEAVIGVQGLKKKGIKLDFKSEEAFIASWEILDSLLDQLTFPVWLNADIITGPVDSDTTPLNGSNFLKLCTTHMPEAVLSLGWTTKYKYSGRYSEQQLAAMQSTIEDGSVRQQSITLAVRAAFAALSKDSLLQLVASIDRFQKNNVTTLTIWMSSNSDSVDLIKLKDLVQSLGKHRVALDVPASIKEALNLNGSPVITARGVLVTVLTSVTAVFYRVFNIFH